jgi:iron complex transport system ATP-binding protein
MHAAVEQALRATQAWDWRARALGQLSGGERQRVLLARALAVQAHVLLMDEPLANLDPPHQADWLRVVRQLVAQGRTVVSVLHEITFALHADELVILDQGRVLHQGACGDAATHRGSSRSSTSASASCPLAGQWVVLPRRRMTAQETPGTGSGRRHAASWCSAPPAAPARAGWPPRCAAGTRARA